MESIETREREIASERGREGGREGERKRRRRALSAYSQSRQKRKHGASQRELKGVGATGTTGERDIVSPTLSPESTRARKAAAAAAREVEREDLNPPQEANRGATGGAAEGATEERRDETCADTSRGGAREKGA